MKSIFFVKHCNDIFWQSIPEIKDSLACLIFVYKTDSSCPQIDIRAKTIHKEESKRSSWINILPRV